MNIDQSAANENMDMPAHIKSYKNFVGFAKFGVVTVAGILILMALFLT